MMKKFLKIFLGIFVFGALLLLGMIMYVEFNQDKILARVKSELQKNIIGELTIEKISLTVLSEFPHLSLTIVHPVIKDSLHRKPVFEAQNVFFRLNLLPLISKSIDVQSIVIEEGGFFLRRDSSGYFNAQIFRVNEQKKAKPGEISFELEKLKLQNLKVDYHDDIYNHHYSVLASDILGNVERTDSSMLIPLNGLVHTDSMLFKPEKGSFFLNRDAFVQLKLEYVSSSKKLNVLPSIVTMDKQRYEMKGAFLLDSKPARLSLYISSPNVDFEQARKVLSPQIQAAMKDITVKTPVDVNIFVRGEINPLRPPEVDANFKIKKANIIAQGINVTEATIEGVFMNHVIPTMQNEDSNSAILFDIKHAKVENVPISGKVSVTNLKKLYLELALSSKGALTNFNSFIPSSKYRFIKGLAEVNLSYTGSLQSYLDSVDRRYDDSLSGTIKVTDGSFVYFKRNLKLDKLTADIGLSIKNIEVRNLSGSLNGNEMFLKGNIASIRKIFVADEQKMQGNFTLDAPQFDLTKVLGEAVVTVAAPEGSTNQKQAELVAKTIDELTDKVTAVLSFKSDAFIFRKLVAKKVKGELTVSSNGILLDKFSLDACKGTLQLKGGLNTQKTTDKLEMHASVKGVDIKDFFKSTENFNQDAFRHENIEGQLSADVYFYAPLGEGYIPVQDSMKAVTHFSWNNGKLINFQPLMDVGKNVFKKRDFANVSFAQVHDSLILKGSKLHIRRMEIASSVMRLFVVGWYDFNDGADFAIQFPLSNLKKQDLNYEPSNIGTDVKVGANVIVRVHGDKNKMKITLDPSAKKRLEKEVL